MGYYSSYLVFVMPAIIISLFAQFAVKSAFSRYSGIYCPLSGAETAKRVLELNGVTGVRIECVSGNLTDHYDPRTNVIRLSESVYNARSIAAVGVAAHEAGHAVQYARRYLPIKIRGVILPICQIGSQLSLPLLLLGILFSFDFLINLGIIFFCGALLFQLVTLPVEFNASRRAMNAIKEGCLLNENEIGGARKVLTAAAMTYVAAVLVSVMQLLRLLSLTSRKRD